MTTKMEEIIQTQLNRMYEVDRDYRNLQSQFKNMETNRAENIKTCNDLYDKFPNEYKAAYERTGFGYILQKIDGLQIDKKVPEF